MGSVSRYGERVLWLSRPPVLRWLAAGSIILAALAWDVAKNQSEPFPFAAVAISAGTVISDDLVDWKSVPEGSIPFPVLDGTTATADIDAGDPLTRSVVAQSPPLPTEWWSVPIEIPTGTPVGAGIRVVLPNGDAAMGIVTEPASSDGYGVPSPGTVGFPPQVADIVARLAATGNLVVLVEP